MAATRALFLLILACVLCQARPALAKPAQYAIDPVHSRILFQVDHAGFSRAIGTFSGISGQLSFDGEDWSQARVEAQVPIARLDLGDEDWNRKILDRSFLDAGGFPQARFVSTRVSMPGPGRLLIEGQLSLHGLTQPVTLEARINAVKRHPLTLRRTAGFSATATISRKAFGIDAWPSLVGDDVRLSIEVEATRERQPDVTGEQADADPQHE